MSIYTAREFAAEAVAHYGEDDQINKAREELRELLEALDIPEQSAFWRHPQTRLDIVDEIADVLVMAMQLRHIFGSNAVDERIAFKVKRQRERMAGRARGPEERER